MFSPHVQYTNNTFGGASSSTEEQGPQMEGVTVTENKEFWPKPKLQKRALNCKSDFIPCPPDNPPYFREDRQ